MVNISLRDVPDELYQQLKQMAELERRSVNQQILVLLERSLKLQQRPSAEVWQRLGQRREAIASRVGLTPNSAELVAEDRSR
ncbi:Arc family DNA-binding protein [Chroococcidiopsis sp. FACHB-1243]|uniref:FitA-like ribbon-helix-helix domain-containing protein n=1 Tax=Chroococcidiopsis sp. [FACHB-1243] TaxID=2692781 RepID=UPI001786D4B7|nr:Arc family DNA-binding protein [Chroococcidiopsis sp. [FACHB-1243]]MBD2310040.1 Arc family DNA-binding protein [Chroococcidiopsis sp. [FACHB-1243]]